MSDRIVRVGGVEVGAGRPLALIAGPCVIESETLAIETAAELKRVADRLGMPFIFKSSYDKANRTSVDSFRGPGMTEGLATLARVKGEIRVPILTDVHTPEECAAAAPIVDCLQIPAFLCRQTDLLVAAGRTGRAVNVKKGQFLAPEDMERAARKVEAGGSGGVLLTERGSTFGYHYLVVDFQGMARMAQTGRPIVFDATHSVQQPGGGSGVSAGERRFAPLLARAAAAVGMDALFVEVHPDPDRALCDGPNSLPLDGVEKVLASVLAVDAARRKTA